MNNPISILILCIALMIIFLSGFDTLYESDKMKAEIEFAKVGLVQKVDTNTSKIIWVKP